LRGRPEIDSGDVFPADVLRRSDYLQAICRDASYGALIVEAESSQSIPDAQKSAALRVLGEYLKNTKGFLSARVQQGGYNLLILSAESQDIALYLGMRKSHLVGRTGAVLIALASQLSSVFFSERLSVAKAIPPEIFRRAGASKQ